MGFRVVLILAAAALASVQCKLINNCEVTKKFVNGHNTRRLLLSKGEVQGQPAASKMTYIIWDEELASKARKWAATNKYGHNPDRTIGSGRFTVGENIYQYGTSDRNYNFNPEIAMDYWFDEHKDYTYNPLSWSDFKSSKQIGHYTQMAWADTIRVGCGISQYFKDDWNYFYVVCDYGPGGNIIGRTPYDSGRASNHLVCGEADCSQRYGDQC